MSHQLVCGAVKEQADLLETVAGIDSLDNEKKIAFAQAIGRQGSSTSYGASESRGGGTDVLGDARHSMLVLDVEGLVCCVGREA